MNHRQLMAALREAGVPDRQYGLQVRDLPSSEYIQESIPVLVDHRDGRWTIDVWERGEHWVEASFDSEEEACDHLYAKFVRH
ncbi:hypothetical protein CG736_30040 [Kitasatospora sp. CB02891]|nr:hypothetical protein CG736_30040 [Kitasatospora sp. CB02891]